MVVIKFESGDIWIKQVADINTHISQHRVDISQMISPTHSTNLKSHPVGHQDIYTTLFTRALADRQ